ncbi:MAG: SUMF1/EgtB/PvdO family nonheme iron enzyme [Elusimicrobiota bacterium]|nr:SUMF1/EgtB/PvdO family nonheme iron enzyme [Elusimicrobiota bacterium]
MNTLLNKAAAAAMLIVLSSALSAAPSLLSPADGAAGVSQSPALSAAELTPGASAQYQFQMNTADVWTAPLFSFDQTAAQSFVGQGAFSGQNTTVLVANDAYSSVSTATFAFYSNTSKLDPDTQYYWRVRVKPFPPGTAYGDWSATASFTTGRFAVQNPANHLAISGGGISGAPGAVSIGFTIAENNVTTATSAGLGAYNTADWIFVKFSTMSGAEGSWNHATLTGGSVGAGAALSAVSDYRGVFFDHTANYAYWTAGATVTWNSTADGIGLTPVLVKVFAISMVHVPTGSFVYNAGAISGSGVNNYGAGAQSTVSDASQRPAGAAANWPNGYNSFYIGRYELTQGQYADFLNTLGVSQAADLHYNSVANGHNITYTSGNPYGSRYAAVGPNAAKNYLSPSDAWSYLSWAGLRPPTEMEFEKAGRDIGGDTRTYPWGNTAPGTATYTPPNEGGTCINKYINYNNTAGCLKVLDVGRYMSGDVYRTAAEAGASPWGIADLGGNAMEIVVDCSYASVPSNGNGTVSWPVGWPSPSVGGYGGRGGSWGYGWDVLRVSDRQGVTGLVLPGRDGNVGARACRTQ